MLQNPDYKNSKRSIRASENEHSLEQDRISAGFYHRRDGRVRWRAGLVGKRSRLFCNQLVAGLQLHTRHIDRFHHRDLDLEKQPVRFVGCFDNVWPAYTGYACLADGLQECSSGRKHLGDDHSPGSLDLDPRINVYPTA